jgi:hypothetical protein
MFVRIWQFRVAPEKADEFRRVYFLTIDRWDSAEAWAAFRRAWGDEYAALDRRCQELTVAEGEIGTFGTVPEG